MTPTDLQETINFNPMVFPGLTQIGQRNLRYGYLPTNTVDSICERVFKFLRVPLSAKDSPCRKREYVEARQIAMFICREKTPECLKVIGKHFGNRDHSTVIYACETVQDLIDTNKAFARKIAEIHELL